MTANPVLPGSQLAPAWPPRPIVWFWGRRLLLVLLALAPCALVVLMIRRYYVDVPVWDQWELVPLLDKMYAGSLSITDLWAQHNEHRLLFPRLLMLGLARVSQWSTAYELGLNVILALGLLAVLVFQFREVLNWLNAPSYVVWLMPGLALQVFSLQQYENWLWGWQIQIFLNALATALGFAVLARPALRGRHFAAACLCGLVALYSFASGIGYWLISAWWLIIAGPERERPLWRVRWLWLAIGLTVVATYLVGYRSPSGHPPLAYVLAQPLQYARYVATYLGAAVAGYHEPWALWVGLAELGLFAGLAWSARRCSPVQQRALWPFFALGLYAIGSALVTGLARAGLGSGQALSSRYGTLAQFLALANLALLAVLVGRLHGRAVWQRALVLLAAVGLVLLIAVNSWRAWPKFADRHAYLLPARAALLARTDDQLLARLYPDPGVVRERAASLEAHGLSVFRPDER